MNEFDVMAHRNFKNDNRFLCAETVSGARFIVSQIKIEGCNVSVKFSDGTICKPEMMTTIQSFKPGELKRVQEFLNNEK